jgi:hypothetical protein
MVDGQKHQDSTHAYQQQHSTTWGASDHWLANNWPHCLCKPKTLLTVQSASLQLPPLSLRIPALTARM